MRTDGAAALAERSSAGPEWSFKPLRLRFMLGDWLIGTAEVRAAFLETHVSRLGTNPALLYPLVSGLAPPVDALVLASHPLAAPMPLLRRVCDALVYVPSQHDHHLIALPDDFDAYLAQLPKKHRHDIARKVRRFVAQTGAPVDCRCYRDADEITAFFRDVEALAGLSYQHRLMKVGLPLGAEFRKASARAAEAGRVRAFVLRARGNPLAFGYCQASGDRLDYVYTGYDPAARDLAPGYVLLHAMLERLCAEKRFALIDLGYGDAQYKRYFATRSLRCATIHVYRANARNRRLVALHRACEGASRGLADALDRLRLKAAVKRLVRG